MPVTPDFEINNIDLPAPSRHGWKIPDDKGFNGNGAKQYTPYFTYELNWDELTQEEFRSIYNIWKGHYNSGTASVKIPEYNAATYQFTTYTGVLMDQPSVGGYSENYVLSVNVVIRKITV